jgi:membrane associated rhomboid family serine protease
MMEDRDYLRKRHRGPTLEGPSAVVILVIINVTALVLRLIFTANPIPPAGAISVAVLQLGEWWTVFTHLFTHADWFHLGFNMAGLFLVGRRVLADTGLRHFVYIYLISGWIAAAFTLLLHPDATMYGASGCVSGVFGAYAALHPERSVTGRLGAWLPRLRARNLFYALLGTTIMLEVFARLTEATLNLPMIHGVAHSAHAAGLLAGWLYARHLLPSLANLYHREEFFPQGLRRRHRDAESFVPSGSVVQRRVKDSLPEPVSSDSAPVPMTNEEFLRQSVDPVLDKLYATGMSSLTEAERCILDEAASRFSRKSPE